MKVLLKRCAGLDVHKETVVACARLMVRGRVEQVFEQFGTTTSELLRLSEWLLAQGCRHAALEATGVYWKPVWHLLEDQIELTLANAMEVRNVPGRKSDISDAAWLADLLAHGLIRGSFVPPRPIQELRDLTRARRRQPEDHRRHHASVGRERPSDSTRIDRGGDRSGTAAGTHQWAFEGAS